MTNNYKTRGLHLCRLSSKSDKYQRITLRDILFIPVDRKLTKYFKYELGSFSNLSVTSPTSQLILQPFRRFTYVTAHSPTLPLLHLRHSSFSNPSFASPTLHALHVIHLSSRPCFVCTSTTSKSDFTAAIESIPIVMLVRVRHECEYCLDICSVT